MLNKELLMTGITGKEPHITLYVDDFYDLSAPDDGYGYGYSATEDTGMVSRIPCWGGYGMMQNYTALRILATVGDKETLISWRNPYSSPRLMVTRLDTGKSIEFVHSDSSTSGMYKKAPFFTRADLYTEIPLIFDPPPTIIWIQLRTTRSKKRVLCRRSSLGGARC